MSATAPLSDRSALLALLKRWVAQGWLREIDAAFPRFLADECDTAPPLLLLAAALASHQLGRGHACLDLNATLADPALALSLPPHDADATAAAAPLSPQELLRGMTLTDWQPILLSHPDLVGDGAGNTPLVYVGQRLYLRRYWASEQAVRAAIEVRVAAARELPQARLRAVLDALFLPWQGTPSPNWQKLACALAARSAFAIVTGGPGTGKTTTVVRLLAVLQTLALAQDDGAAAARPLRIRLAAPTGKAAARLVESIRKEADKLPLEGLGVAEPERIRAAIPCEATTLHRLLGNRPHSRRFRHNAVNPLPVDVVVVDEASMVDLEMMAALLTALPPAARLLLLGDKDQLASVEAGSVLGELCRHAEAGHYSPQTAEWLKSVTGQTLDAAHVDADGTGLDQAVAMLRHSWRFDAHSGIGHLARAVNTRDADNAKAVREVLGTETYSDLARLTVTEKNAELLRRLVVDGGDAVPAAQDAKRREPRVGYSHYLQTLHQRRPGTGTQPAADADAWAQEVLKAYGCFQLLSALRKGPWGVEGLNQRVAEWLRQDKLIAQAEGWYVGRPVLVTRNDYGLGLMNGDIGITLDPLDASGQPVLRVAFPAGADGQGVRWIPPSRLQAIDTVYAMTVHKSQGSEFTHAALVLPERDNPILTRELVYTGLTRAREWFSLVEAGDDCVLDLAVQRQVVRHGGLMPSSSHEFACPAARP